MTSSVIQISIQIISDRLKQPTFFCSVIYVSNVSCFTIFQWGPCFGGGLWDTVSGKSTTGQIRGPQGRALSPHVMSMLTNPRTQGRAALYPHKSLCQCLQTRVGPSHLM